MSEGAARLELLVLFLGLLLDSFLLQRQFGFFFLVCIALLLFVGHFHSHPCEEFDVIVERHHCPTQRVQTDAAQMPSGGFAHLERRLRSLRLAE